jgi:hypothetical protein
VIKISTIEGYKPLKPKIINKNSNYLGNVRCQLNSTKNELIAVFI